MTVLQERNPAVRAVAFSNRKGFRLLGTADRETVVAAAHEAMLRLHAGEHHLAVNQRCGTTVAVGVLVGTVGLWLNDLLKSPRHKIALGIATSVAIAVVSQPMGLLAQRHFTTKPHLGGLRVREVRGRALGNKYLLEVITSG